MITGVVCMSHSPLLDRNRTDAGCEARFNAAIRSAEEFTATGEPELTVVFFPDHLSGFFYNMMPSFCVGAAGSSIGDYGTAPGQLDIPEDIAMDCAAACIADGIDVAVSLKMSVDHGAVQPIEMLSTQHALTRIIPIFINCAAAPRPTFDRVRALGRAVGGWAEARPERILFVASGGLSHDPPLPSLKGATPEVRDRLVNGGALTHKDRVSRQNRVLGEGVNFVAGTSKLRPLNPEWDRSFLDALVSGDLASLDHLEDEEITTTAGRGGHEVRSWVAALAAIQTRAPYKADVLFYAPIPEWITGMGILTAAAA
jgi:2,3-dihydroxyphenylpropionate 1,2-dioxygenase